MTAALVLIAGGPVAVAARLGLAMFALQAAIGTANDLIDEPVDRGLKVGKPLPRGLLTRRAAQVLFGIALSVGLALSAASGAVVLVLALAGLSVGLAYDRWAKGTVWSWLPFAAGIPLLPVYAWLGATDSLPSAFLVLVPTGVIAGAALALANLLADLERDRASGADTAATRLGPNRALAVCAGLHTAVALVAVGSLVALGGRGSGIVAAAGGLGVVASGLVLGRRGRPLLRERAWELQAAGIGLLAAGWVAALADAGSL